MQKSTQILATLPLLVTHITICLVFSAYTLWFMHRKHFKKHLLKHSRSNNGKCTKSDLHFYVISQERMAFTFLLFVVLGLKDAKQVNQLLLSYTLSLILHFKQWKELQKMIFYDMKDIMTVNSLIGAQLCSLLCCPIAACMLQKQD